jgi:hypothetical protein
MFAIASAANAISIGSSSSASAPSATAVGMSANAQGSESVAVGNSSKALGTNSVAMGNNATAGNTSYGGPNSTAVGANSSATYTNSAAFGAGAQSIRANQQVFGTTSNVYTMPGLTSAASRANQTGLLQLPTSDANGNLASDGGATFKAIAKLQAGVAVAMAIAPPVLANGENFGIRIGYGVFGSYGQPSNAVGLSALGVLAKNIFSDHDRLALEAGGGIGFSQFMGYQESAVAGGQAGLQLTW